jgi:hypothetical protein
MQNLNYNLQIKTVDNKVLEFSSNQSSGAALTIDFNIVRTVDSTANKMDMKITNLSLNTRTQINKDKYAINEYIGIKLRAGRETMKLIFQGNIIRAWSNRSSAEIITNINALDGGFAMYNSNSSVSFSAGTPEDVVVKTLFKDMKKNGIEELSYSSDPTVQTTALKKGTTFDGNTFKQIQHAAPNKSIYIDNEVIFVKPPIYILATNNSSNKVKLITSSTGLLDVPIREGGFITVNMIFNPDIFVDDIIEIKSSVDPQFDGQYTVSGITHTGTISGSKDSNCKTILQLLIGDANLKNLQF